MSNAQLTSNCEFDSSINAVFSRIGGVHLVESGHPHVLKAASIDTPLGSMLVVSDDQSLYLLTFVQGGDLKQQINRLKKMQFPIALDTSDPIKQIRLELAGYFSGKLQEFKTPLYLVGSSFQNRVWKELQIIPKGRTKSYAEIAQAIGKPLAFRAVALANAANPFAIAIPCHRVIYSNGMMGGYSGGLKRKEWLLTHERK